MIAKFFFTLLIIAAALLFIRHKQREGRRHHRQDLEQQAQLAAERRHAWRVAVALLAVMLLISGALYYDHWQGQHRLFSVQVINSLTGGEQRYRVYQSELNGRSFRTLDGRLIYLSDSERMEVQESGE